MREKEKQKENKTKMKTGPRPGLTEWLVTSSLPILSPSPVWARYFYSTKCPQLLYWEDHYLQICLGLNTEGSSPQHMRLLLWVSRLASIETRMQHCTNQHTPQVQSMLVSEAAIQFISVLFIKWILGEKERGTIFINWTLKMLSSLY